VKEQSQLFWVPWLETARELLEGKDGDT